MKRLRYRLYIRWLALRWVFQFNLGDEVWHRGRKRGISNWAGCPLMTLTDPYEQYVPREECRKVWSLANCLSSYRAGIGFYEKAWLEIWVGQGIQPWIRALKIWPGKQRT